MNKPPPFKGVNLRIPTRIPIKGRGFIKQGSGLSSTRDHRHRSKTEIASEDAENPTMAHAHDAYHQLNPESHSLALEDLKFRD